MKTIQLTQGQETQVDDADYDFLVQLSWHAHKCVDGRYYAMLSTYDGVNRGAIPMHKLLIKLKPGEIADHIDRDSLNNQRNNLRISNKRGNGANAKLSKANTSGFKGVSKQRDGRFIAQCCKGGKHCRLGVYDDPREAARAYDEAAIKAYGEFAATNAKLGLLN